MVKVYWFANVNGVREGMRKALWIGDRIDEAQECGEWEERWEGGLRGMVELSVSGVPFGVVDEEEVRGWPLFSEMVPVKGNGMKHAGEMWASKDPMRDTIEKECAAAEVLRKLREKRKRDARGTEGSGSGADSPAIGPVAR